MATFAKSPGEDNGPYLSFNQSITEPDELGPEADDESVCAMEKINPKLEQKWVVWEQRKPSKNSKNLEYVETMKKTLDFHSVKEFWSCWNYLPQPSELLNGKKFMRETEDGDEAIVDCLAIFKEGIAPQWEDPKNHLGGHFMLTLKPSLPPGLVDELWNNTVFGMITGSMQEYGLLTGVRLVDKLDNKTKPHIRIEVWFSDLDEASAKGGQGPVYDLRGSFEKCIRIGLSGDPKSVSWGNTTTVPH